MVKTISVKEAAYRRLTTARRYPAESFSEIVMRATWPEDTLNARGLKELMAKRRPLFTPAQLDALDAMQRLDAPPEDKWAEG